jgi:hypothetical protein
MNILGNTPYPHTTSSPHLLTRDVHTTSKEKEEGKRNQKAHLSPLVSFSEFACTHRTAFGF